ncbi:MULTISPECIES: hypothetical protein [Pseudomonas]|uniref:Uncharacterized protein n=3 Tax=Pseudomonas juntendi TaxID=2666183 RepID=A0A7W2LTY6_9PSED|nr:MULTISPECIES: hypothetical protein [Pseudomonas]MBA6131726.1 hypothetical protein [Pseudomonas juntendi]MBA6146971.1 hypothetical protein [Pseudomonas juntendi]MCK2110560.1 hypothetical protein [Pseudomonas juntendi]MCK2115331.1 hypothetical protein [Pseudomonas juntendi]
MSRGFLSFMADTAAYRDSEKKWVVNLQRFDRYWYDLVVNPHEVAEYFDSRQLIIDYLKRVKQEVEDVLEKRFVYFICSRERVRFNTKKSPRYNPLTRSVKLHLLIGKDKIKRAVHCRFFDVQRQRFCKPKIELCEKYITVTDTQGNLYTRSIHDFLEDANIFLGLDSRVEYVGYTKNPESRPTNGEHTGLNHTLHRLADDSRDSLIYFNLFKVITRASNENFMLDFAMANAMTDEVNVDLEGKIIEKCFILYFDAAGQDRNKKNELAELAKNLRRLSEERKINRIFVHYEFENLTEYGVFSSSEISKNIRHVFTVKVTDAGVEIEDERGQVRVFS